MKKRLFIYTTLIILTGLLCFFAASVYSTNRNNLRIAEDTVIETTRIYAALYNAGIRSGDADGMLYIDTDSDTRITIISSAGTVLADSRPLNLSAVETHLDRPEIAAAAGGTPATFTRRSETLGVDLIYYALKVDLQGSDDYVFVRAAIPVARISSYLSASLPFLILILVIIITLCFVLSRTMINRMTEPLESVKQELIHLSEGEYTRTPLTSGLEEIDAIVSEIDDVAQILQRNMKELQDEKDKAEYILDNIGDAIFALDAASDIALINNSALRVFDVTADITGKSINYLTYNKMLLDAIEECFEHGKSSLSELAMDGRIYTLSVIHLEGSALTVVILSDITDSRESSRRREEFFENASHELKTPLTAIKGFNELCAMNNKDEDLVKYIDGITRETDRMLTLIGDMLKLSELSNTNNLHPVPVSLRETAQQVFDTLTAAVNEKGLAFDITGDCNISAEPEHVFELIKNLAENAVRYNTQNGSVTIELSDEHLKVSDTGIGIPLHAQPRLFERFYRVEKSRSIRSGGTGLGLAIVKHICTLYGWDLSLRSKPSVGTEVTVVFNASPN